MNAKGTAKYASRGIFTVTELSYTFRPRRRPRRLRDKREKYHNSLKALAIREGKIHVVGKPELKLAGTPVYLDVESLPELRLLLSDRSARPDWRGDCPAQLVGRW